MTCCYRQNTYLIFELRYVNVLERSIKVNAIHMFRYHLDLLPPDLPSVSFINQSDIHNHNTRQVSDFHIAATNTKLAQNTSLFTDQLF